MVQMQMTLEGAKLELEKLNMNIDKAAVGMGKLNSAFRQYLALARRFGISGDIMQLMVWAQQGKIAVETLTRSIYMFYTTTGPLGLAIAGAGLALGLLMTADLSMAVGDSVYDRTHGA